MILRAENLVKKYKKRTVVNNVSVQVRQGEIVRGQNHQLLHDRGVDQTQWWHYLSR
jgi:ABC-type lipopolysaccharide export system ATPase subunit